MTELHVLDRFTDERNDYLEPEIAEKLSTEHRETVDELQLAALLGKTLLEKNGELELKLKRLQEFAEETLVAKQTLTRQLCESRDSLQFSNATCEQLEAKVEELEATNEELVKFCEDRQVVIEQKSAVVRDLREKADSLEQENRRLKDELEQSQLNTEISEGDGAKALQRRHSSNVRAYMSPEHYQQQKALLEQVTALQEALGKLTLKLQSAQYQRQKLQNELAEVVEENQLLCKTLEKSEMESAELQAKLKLYEEASERQHSLDSSLSSVTSNRRHRTPSSTPLHSNGFHDHFLLPSPGPEDYPMQRSPKMPLDLDDTLGVSLFSELDIQHTTLHKQYSQLLHDCTCSASLTHNRRQQLGVTEADGDQSQDGKQTVGLTQTDRPFKQLFDDVFATLKQTAQVADRLIERRSSNVN